MDQKHLKLICDQLNLGSYKNAPVRIYGGRGGHLMWRVETDAGIFCIKQLAPDLDINNEKIVTKYELSEAIAKKFSKHGIKAVYSLDAAGKHLIIIDGKGYLVYHWVDGHALKSGEVSRVHAIEIAELLARIHSINLEVPEAREPPFDIHSDEEVIDAINSISKTAPSIAASLASAKKLILSMNEKYHASIPLLKESAVVTHGDMDQLNVIWDATGEPNLIDWESAKRMNTTRDIIRMSLGWSGIGRDGHSSQLYEDMLRVYIQSGGILKRNHINPALDSTFASMLYWMIFNIKKVQNGDDSNEIKNNIISAFESIKRLNKMMPDLIKITEKIYE